MGNSFSDRTVISYKGCNSSLIHQAPVPVAESEGPLAWFVYGSLRKTGPPCHYVKFYLRMKHSIFLTWLSNHITSGSMKWNKQQHRSSAPFLRALSDRLAFIKGTRIKLMESFRFAKNTKLILTCRTSGEKQFPPKCFSISS